MVLSYTDRREKNSNKLMKSRLRMLASVATIYELH
jgi:hypothetical protein